MKPLLSICIPTYNHAGDLASVLKSITGTRSFLDTEDVEIVISDNASTDRTRSVAEQYVRSFPGRIAYFCNENNVRDENFGLALKRGRGVFRKLANDTLVFSEFGVKALVSAVAEYAGGTSRPHLFFTNEPGATPRIDCASPDEFFREVSFRSTWIGAFGVWESDLSLIDDFSRRCELQLSQVDALLRLMKGNPRSVVFNFVFATMLPRPRKGGYSIARVFGKNYFLLLEEAVSDGLISRCTYRREKAMMLKRHLLPFYLTFSHGFSSEGYVLDLLPIYKCDPFYWMAMPLVYGMALLKFIGKPMKNIFRIWNDFLRVVPHLVFWLRWKRRNRHNLTAPVNVFDMDRVSVGKGTYGGIEVYTYGAPEAKLLIGNYCSIGPHVRFMLSGEHKTDGVSTYPFKAYDPVNPECEDVCRGPIVVKDDVWFGIGVTVLSGVTIGQGAVIGAGAVVTKDVEPYAIVGGVPAKLIRYRVGDELKAKLLKIDWASMTPEKYRELSDSLKI